MLCYPSNTLLYPRNKEEISEAEKLYKTVDGKALRNHMKSEYPSKWIRNCPRYLKGREYVECIQARIASLKTPSRIARGERAHLGKQCRYCKWKVH